ncbi:protoporphyrinogen oxidase [Hoyosella subflava]|uniref:Coproporphyrinogen III oxidase n=1 Tax=Hoyosella subflava (strain DSM 45089 / JCM 17490 / NBRC 109087 / DQS3-9A1) TaxID=443218 RepID=F6ELI0_HOYSD|nr:protoporphyrinogen oxidase [Hoyosella subflava]AEF40230.1 Protoporphyrinogen oxidase [Hoyosella subflava DQS3-9A1]
MPVRHALVLGGGIAGLTAAYRLRQALGPAAAITVCEASESLGGKLRTLTIDDGPVDVGAEAFVQRRPEVLSLAKELGLGDELVTPSSVRPVIWADGSAHPLPPGAFMGIPASEASIKGLKGLVSAAAEGYAAGEAKRLFTWETGADWSLAQLVRERFGEEVVRKSVDPLIAGVYAGDSSTVGIRAAIPELARALDSGAASLTAAVRGAFKPATGSGPVFATFRNGYQTLLNALERAAGAEVRLSASARVLSRAGKRWRTDVASDADIVILALPAHALPGVISGHAPAAAAAAAEIRHASSAVVTFAFDDDSVLPEWSGVLVAGGEKLDAKAVTLTSRKWPHQGGRGLLRVSLGRFGDDPPVTALPDENLVRVARADLRVLTGIDVDPRLSTVQRWPDGLPQYEPGHQRRVQAIEEGVLQLPGIGVAGGYLHGVGVPACIASADAAVTKAIGDVAG